MSGVYIAETLRALNKNQIIDLFLKSQEQTNTTIASLTAEIKRLNENFQKLESDVSVVKNVNNILSKQMSSIKRQCWKDAQYSVRDLEPTVFRVLLHIVVGITGKGIEACHRLNRQSDRTIVRFPRRKDCEHVMQKKSELRKLKPSELDVRNGTKLYINESFCPYYRVCGINAKSCGTNKEYFLFSLLMAQ